MSKKRIHQKGAMSEGTDKNTVKQPIPNHRIMPEADSNWQHNEINLLN